MTSESGCNSHTSRARHDPKTPREAHGYDAGAMTARFFQRACRVSVGTVEATDLRVTFKVKKSMAREPNTCELEVYNLSQFSRASLQEKHLEVKVEAAYGSISSSVSVIDPKTGRAYEDRHAIVFQGQVRTIDHVRDGPNWVTKVYAGDGDLFWKYAQVTGGWEGNVKVATILDELLSAAEKQGIPIDTKDARRRVQTFFGAYENGWAYKGKTRDALTSVLTGLTPKQEWSVQDGRMAITTEGEPTSDIVVDLAPDSGLIGWPEGLIGAQRYDALRSKDKKLRHRATFIKAKCLLNPTLRAGALVRLMSKSHPGLYRIEELQHSGDTHGQDWHSELTLSVAKPVGQKKAVG